MKYLQILRHAKSSWKDLNLSDHDRPLNKRGKRTAPVMGKRLAIKSIQPKLIISSTAKRAVLTAQIVANEIDYDVRLIQKPQSMYHASANELLKFISQVNNQIDSLMIVGHNPGLTSLANQLCSGKHYFDNIPTAGLVTLSIDVTSWKQLDDYKVSERVGLLDYDFPKKQNHLS